MPDVLVGRLLVVTRDDRRLRAEYMDLPPPPPFEENDVSLMWEALRASAVPLPMGIRAQGRLDLADPSELRSEGLEPEFLPLAHSAARALVAEWPRVESVQHVWRPIDVTAGREDEPSTEKRAGLFPAIERQDGTRRPTSSSRILPSGHPWYSNQLAAMAREVLKRIDLVSDLKNPDLVAPFEVVARQAHDQWGAPERSLSTWPARASAALMAFGALLSDVAPTDAGSTSAPLCHLWRLYEAWLAVQMLRSLTNDDRLSQRALPEHGRGDDWHVVFDSPKGRIILVAQPEITKDAQSCEILEPAALFSVSSELRPDVLVAVENEASGTWQVEVYDAKKRTHAMTSGEVAEAASKYVWGIRRIDPTRCDDLAVSAVTLVSTAKGGSMFSADARIGSLRAMPSGLGVAGLKEFVRARLNI